MRLAKRMRLVHRRKERVLTRSTVPLLTIPLELPTLPLLLLLGGEGQRTEERDRGVRERKEGEESYSRLLGEGLACGKRTCL